MPSLPASPSSPLQFLNTVLSQRLPNHLPYEEDLKWHIRQHLLALIRQFPGLHVRTAMFPHSNGKTVNLLQAHGTIPMLYKEVKYNIPVVVWLLESYPRNPPRVYVTPTRDMIIKPRHRFVDSSGLVSTPVFEKWIFPRSNLVELAQNLSEMFGEDPPLYSRQPASLRAPREAPHGMDPSATALESNVSDRTPYLSYSTCDSSASSSSSSSGRGSPLRALESPRLHPAAVRQLDQPDAASPRRYLYSRQHLSRMDSPSSMSYPAPPQLLTKAEAPCEIFRRNAINYLTQRLQRDVLGFEKSCDGEMNELCAIQKVLKKRSLQLAKGVVDLKQEKEELHQQVQLVLANADALETWLKENNKVTSQVDLDDVFQATDTLSRQMLECRASDLAIEDTLYSLDKAVECATIPLDIYLKNVRSLSREQFFLRATTLKVRAAQLHILAFGVNSHASLCTRTCFESDQA